MDWIVLLSASLIPTLTLLFPPLRMPCRDRSNLYCRYVFEESKQDIFLKMMWNKVCHICLRTLPFFKKMHSQGLHSSYYVLVDRNLR